MDTQELSDREYVAKELGRFAEAGHRDALMALCASRDAAVVGPLISWWEVANTKGSLAVAAIKVADRGRLSDWEPPLKTLANIAPDGAWRLFEKAIHGEYREKEALMALLHGNLKEKSLFPVLVQTALAYRSSEYWGPRAVRQLALDVLGTYGPPFLSAVAAALDEHGRVNGDVAIQALEFLVQHGQTGHVKALVTLATEGINVKLRKGTAAVGRVQGLTTVDVVDGVHRSGSPLFASQSQWAVQQLTALLGTASARIGSEDLQRILCLPDSTIELEYAWDEESGDVWVSSQKRVALSQLRKLARQRLASLS